MLNYFIRQCFFAVLHGQTQGVTNDLYASQEILIIVIKVLVNSFTIQPKSYEIQILKSHF